MLIVTPCHKITETCLWNLQSEKIARWETAGTWTIFRMFWVEERIGIWSRKVVNVGECNSLWLVLRWRKEIDQIIRKRGDTVSKQSGFCSHGKREDWPKTDPSASYLFLIMCSWEAPLARREIWRTWGTFNSQILSLSNICWLLLKRAGCQKELSLDNSLILTVGSLCVVRHPSWEESEELDSGLKPLNHFGVVFTTVLFLFLIPH